MTAPNIEELITHLRPFFIDERRECSKANQTADLLQSQAERIAELEQERDELREKYTDTYEALDDAARENTRLRAQLAAIAATKPINVCGYERNATKGTTMTTEIAKRKQQAEYKNSAPRCAGT